MAHPSGAVATPLPRCSFQIEELQTIFLIPSVGQHPDPMSHFPITVVILPPAEYTVYILKPPPVDIEPAAEWSEATLEDPGLLLK